MSRREHSRGIKLNCSLSVPTSSDSSLHTPNTPEILNTIVNITESLGHNTAGHALPLHPLQIKNALLSDNAIIPAPIVSSSSTPCLPPPLISPCSPATPAEFLPTTPSSPPAPSEYPSPSSPDHHSVKEELKLKVAKNLRRVSEESMVYPGSIKRERDDLTADDEEKRRRRRERNKVAAEKCRNKRKKAVEKLYSESESVSIQNAKFKEDIARLEAEHRHLLLVLEQHKPVCRRNDSSSRDNSEGGILNPAEDVVKKEAEDSSDMFRDRVDTFSNVYKYSGDVYDSSINYNFGFSGGYYDTACFAV